MDPGIRNTLVRRTPKKSPSVFFFSQSIIRSNVELFRVIDLGLVLLVEIAMLIGIYYWTDLDPVTSTIGKWVAVGGTLLFSSVPMVIDFILDLVIIIKYWRYTHEHKPMIKYLTQIQDAKDPMRQHPNAKHPAVVRFRTFVETKIMKKKRAKTGCVLRALDFLASDRFFLNVVTVLAEVIFILGLVLWGDLNEHVHLTGVICYFISQVGFCLLPHLIQFISVALQACCRPPQAPPQRLPLEAFRAVQGGSTKLIFEAPSTLYQLGMLDYQPLKLTRFTGSELLNAFLTVVSDAIILAAFTMFLFPEVALIGLYIFMAGFPVFTLLPHLVYFLCSIAELIRIRKSAHRLMRRAKYDKEQPMVPITPKPTDSSNSISTTEPMVATPTPTQQQPAITVVQVQPEVMNTIPDQLAAGPSEPSLDTPMANEAATPILPALCSFRPLSLAPDCALRTLNSRGTCDANPTSSFAQDATWKMIPALDGTVNAITFESSNNPGQCFANVSGELFLRRFEENEEFKQGCSFHVRRGLAGNEGASFELTHQPAHFIRHNAQGCLVLSGNDGSEAFARDATWMLCEPLAPVHQAGSEARTDEAEAAAPKEQSTTTNAGPSKPSLDE